VSSLLRAPAIALKWVLVAVGVLAWITLVPIVDLIRTAVARLVHPRSGRR
jgi:hypothetical protein